VRIWLVLLGAVWADEGADMGRRVQELLRAHQTEIFACVAAQPREPDGEMLLRVFVDEGKAGRVDVLKDQTGNAALARCLSDTVWKWDLASLKADSGDQIVFPLAFHQGAPMVTIDKVAACDGSSAFYVLKAGKFNGKPVQAGDVIYAPIKTCKLEKAEVLRVRVPGTLSGEPAVITPPAPYNIKGGTVRLFLDGKAPFALDLMTIDAGVTVPPHKHDNSEELIYVLSGRSSATVGGKEQKAGPGDQVRMPPGVEHTVTIDEKLTAVQVYAPAGPEQRFKK
jgi:quercetin dioxygenase-like cupin family protein